MGIHAPSRLGRQDRQDSQSTQRSSCHQGPLGMKNSRQRASFLRCGRWPREKPEPFSYAAWMSACRGATATFFRGPPFSRTARQPMRLLPQQDHHHLDSRLEGVAYLNSLTSEVTHNIQYHYRYGQAKEDLPDQVLGFIVNAILIANLHEGPRH